MLLDSENITLKRASVLESAVTQDNGDLDLFSVYVHGKVANVSLDPHVQVIKHT